ncbi:unnamed protein product [Angiostrongylus costaricensis]|uniref:SH2 domain-containing protein n=1 Tax=Angiostrongylus costaricensis TaxID=334426 RepID=A0A158PFF2_ANGCS|nr:unnamed protein product [Angiostrongylus costaricensis]
MSDVIVSVCPMLDFGGSRIFIFVPFIAFIIVFLSVLLLKSCVVASKANARRGWATRARRLRRTSASHSTASVEIQTSQAPVPFTPPPGYYSEVMVTDTSAMYPMYVPPYPINTTPQLSMRDPQLFQGLPGLQAPPPYPPPPSYSQIQNFPELPTVSCARLDIRTPSRTNDLVTPFLTRILGQMQAVSANLKCDKQNDDQYLYEYSLQVRPDTEFEDMAGCGMFLDIWLLGQLDYREEYCGPKHIFRSFPSLLAVVRGGVPLQTTSLISQGSHFDAGCAYMVEVRFVLFHQNMNGTAQLRIKDEFPCYMTVREVIDYFRLETDGVHRGVFAPRLSYAVGCGGGCAHQLLDSDLEKTLAELCDNDEHFNTIAVIADLTN